MFHEAEVSRTGLLLLPWEKVQIGVAVVDERYPDLKLPQACADPVAAPFPRE
jgi:hypothetical protein